MDLLFLIIPLAVVFTLSLRAEQRQRIQLLGERLSRYQIEPRMQQLADGYLRALGESDPERAEPVWRNLQATEEALQQELTQLAEDLKDVWGERLRVSRWPIALPMATRLFPQASFDFRALVALHAERVSAVLENAEQRSRRDRAFVATAELLLFQHSCHWFCRSKTVASARLLALHKTGYEQVLAAVAPATRQRYLAVVLGT